MPPEVVDARVRRVDDAGRARAQRREALSLDAHAVEHRERPFGVGPGRLCREWVRPTRLAEAAEKRLVVGVEEEHVKVALAAGLEELRARFPTSPRNARTRTSMPSATRVIPPRSQSATACGASAVGRLSTQKKPRSSSACRAWDLPAPERPLTTTTCGVRARVRRLVAHSSSSFGGTRATGIHAELSVPVACGMSVDQEDLRGLRFARSGAVEGGVGVVRELLGLRDDVPLDPLEEFVSGVAAVAAKQLVSRGHLDDASHVAARTHRDPVLANGCAEDRVVTLLDPEPVELLLVVPLAELHDEVDALAIADRT